MTKGLEQIVLIFLTSSSMFFCDLESGEKSTVFGSSLKSSDSLLKMNFSNWLGGSERTWLPLSLLSYSHSCSYTLIPESKVVSNIDSSK